MGLAWNLPAPSPNYWVRQLQVPLHPTFFCFVFASYSTLLLVIRNWSCTSYFRMSPSGEVMTTLTSPIFYSDDPYVWIVHRVDVSCTFSSSDKVISTIKLANTWAFIIVRGLYSMSNWLSLIAHYTIHPTTSGLFIAFLIGWSVITKIWFAWK